jgi:hypothetical protein
MKYRIVVDADLNLETERTSYEVLQPKEQDKLSSDQMAAVLSGALALCIRASENEAEVMRMVMDYLESEFINPNSFSDLKVLIDKSNTDK